MKLKLEEEEVWKQDILMMSDEELSNLTHLYKVRHDILKDEVNKRFDSMFPDIPKSHLESISPLAKNIILQKLNEKY